MVDKIYEIKNAILEHVEMSMQDLNRVDVKEMGEFVDMVKDLAESEKNCWKATYYRSLVQAMETHDVDARGYDTQRQPVRQPVGFTSISPQNDVVKKLGEEYRSLPKEERLMMKSRILNVIGSM